MATWYVVAMRETCPKCSGFGQVILYEETIVMPNGGISRPAKPSKEWPTCDNCNGCGHIETQVDLREALRDILNESIAADNR